MVRKAKEKDRQVSGGLEYMSNIVGQQLSMIIKDARKLFNKEY